MAKKQETKDMQGFTNSLQKVGYFRNISDKYQIGIPDLLGGYRGTLVGIEFKSVGEFSGIVPPKGHHPFTPTQIKELKHIVKDGGVGIGVIMCGKFFVWVFPEEIDNEGRVNIDDLILKHPTRLWNTSCDYDQFLTELVEMFN